MLLQPLGLRCGIELPNRVMFGPHVTNLGDHRSFGARHAAYYGRRSSGGASLVVTETASVHPLDWPYERCPLATDCKVGWAAIVEACPDSAVVAALGHAGMQGSSAYSQRELMAPSRVPDAVTRELPKEMEHSDIVDVLDGFGAAAAVAVHAGCHGVEINAGQHSLVRQFMSGLTNLRSDHWGLGVDGVDRLRFVDEVLARVRTAVGTDRIVGLRLSCDEMAPWAGITPDSAAEIAAALAPQVDYLVVERGSIYSADATRPDTHVEAGFNSDLVRQIRAAVGATTAVIAQGSIVEPHHAAELIGDGSADAVEMTRAQIADPDLVATIRSGGAPRPCIRCNQKCQVRDARNPIVSCTVNPSAGFEATEPESPGPAPADGQRSLAIIGAGPSGLEAARLLAGAGHAVSVHDRAHEVGSVVRTLALASGREPFVAIIDWLEAQCTSAGVTFELGSALTAADVESIEATGTEVIIATGSAQGLPTYEVANDASVVAALDLLGALREGTLAPPTDSVVVLDPIGGPIGISIAETLAPDAGEITLVTPDVIAGTMLALTGDLAAASTRLANAGVRIEKRAIARRVTAIGVEIEDRFTGERRTLPASLVVDAGHRVPANGPEADDRRTIGDAVAPRSIHEAILDGRRLAIELSASIPVSP